MGVRESTRSMLTVCEQLAADADLLIDLTKKNKKQGREERIDNIQNLGKHLKACSYDEEKAEQIVRRVIEKSKVELLALIKNEAGFTKKQKEADALVHKIHSITKGDLTPVRLRAMKRDIQRLETLLTEETDISSAMERVSQNLQALMLYLQTVES